MADLHQKSHSIMAHSVLISNIFGLLKNHLYAAFPSSYFKGFYIKNSAFNLNTTNKSDDDKFATLKPSLTLYLSLSYQDPTFSGDPNFFGRTYLRKNAHLYKSIYKNILVDEISKIYVSSFEERTKLSFDILVRVDSEMQAYNTLQFIRSIGVKKPYYINNALIESPLPYTVINDIIKANDGKYSMKDNDSILEFQDYLRTASAGNITFKKNNASGNFFYYYRYNSNILCKIVDVPTIDLSTDNKVTTDGQVKFTMELEFNNHMHYITEHEEFSDKYTMEDLYPEDTSNTIVFNTSIIQPIKDKIGEFILSKVITILSEINQPIDSTNFENLLISNHKEFIKHVVKLANNDLHNYTQLIEDNIKIVVYEDSKELLPEEYTIDWDTLDITLFNPKMNYVYGIAIYVHGQNMSKYFEADQATNTRYGQSSPNKMMDGTLPSAMASWLGKTS